MKERLQKSTDSNASLGEGDFGGGNQVAKDSRWTFPWFPKLKISFAQLLLAPILIIYLLKVINAGLIDYSLIPLFLLLVYFTARQIQCMVFQRVQLLSLGLSASEWSGILLLRATGLIVLVAISLWPSPWIANFFIDPYAGLWAADHTMPLIAAAVLVGVILTTLPVTHPAKRIVPHLRTVEQICWYVLFCMAVLMLCLQTGIVYFDLARAVDSYVFGFPLRLHHGEIKLSENQYNNAYAMRLYYWATLPAVISSAIALMGAIVAVRSKRFGWLGVIVWCVSACVAIPYGEWLLREGWKLRLAVSQFDGYAIELWYNFALTDLLYFLPLLVLLTAAFGTSYRSVRDPILIRELRKLDPPVAVYWLLLATMCVCFNDPHNFEKVRYTFALFLGVSILGLVCSTKCDPTLWLSKLRRWQRFPVIVVLGIPFYYYFLPISFRILYGGTFSAFPIEAAGYIFFFTSVLLAWAVCVIVRPQRPPSDTKELAAVAIRDLYLARNVWLMPILSISLAAFVFVWSLTICEYLSLWFWQN